MTCSDLQLYHDRYNYSVRNGWERERAAAEISDDVIPRKTWISLDIRQGCWWGRELVSEVLEGKIVGRWGEGEGA